MPTKTTKKIERSNAKPAPQARSAALREAFLKAGFELLNEHSLDNLSVPQIAKRAGSSVGGFYSRFENKEAFFLCLRDEQVSRGVALVDEKLPATLFEQSDTSAIVETIVATYCDIFNGPGRGVLRETFMQLNRSPELWAPMRESGRYASDYITENLTPRLGDDAEPRIRFAVQVMLSVLVNDLVNPNHPFKSQQHEFQQYLATMLTPFLSQHTER